MPRKGHTQKRDVLADPLYNNKVVTKLINNIMLDGKKGVAQKIVYGAFERVAEKADKPAIEVFEEAMNNIMPVLEVKARRIGGATYQVPIEVRADRRQALALRWITLYSRKRGEKTIQKVTIKHLLTMTAPYKYKYEPWTKICSSDDWTVSALDFLGGRKGLTGQFKYSTLGIHILTGIISKTSGLKVVDFANKFLFEPIGVEKHINYLAETAEEHKHFTICKEPQKNIWFCDPKGIGTAGYGLCFSAIDMAKIGQLCLDKGVHNGKQLVSSKWIEEITKPNYKCGEEFRNMSYGYLWWIVNENVYAAIGNSGNVIYVNSLENIVIAVTSYFKPTIFDRIDFIQKYIEPFISI